MKRVLLKALALVLSFVLLFALVSCGPNGNNDITENTTDKDSTAIGNENEATGSSGTENTDNVDDTGQPADYTDEFEKIMSSSLDTYDNYSFTLQKYKYDGDTMSRGDKTTAILCEEGWVIYAGDGKSGGLFVNDGKKYYSIDVPNKTKKLIVEGAAASTISWNSNISTYSALMTEHQNYPEEIFTRQGNETIAGRSCVKYKVDGKSFAANPEIEYWFDLQTGLTLKAITKMQVSAVSSVNHWEIIKFNIGSQSIDEFINFKEA